MSAIRFDRRPVIGMGTLIAGVFLLWGAGSGFFQSIVNHTSTHEVKAVFANAQQLRKGDDVRIDGVSEGKVASIQATRGARSALVTMNVDDDAGQLHRDTRATLRWTTVLGGLFYVDLDRGSRSSGPLGAAPIPARNTTGQVELDDLTGVLSRRAISGLQTLPGELSKSLSDSHAVADALTAVSDISPDAQTALDAARGVVKDRDLQQLIQQTAKTTMALDAPRNGMQQLVSGAAATLRTIGGRGAELRQTLVHSPAALDGASVTTRRLDTTLGLADGLLTRLRPAAPQVARTLAQLRPTVIGADRLLSRAEPLLHRLRPAVRSLAGASRTGLPLLTELLPSLERLDTSILPMLSEVDPGTERSTAVMIGGTFENVGGSAGQMDTQGHFIRFPATAGSSPLYSLPCSVYLGNPDKAQQIACDSLQGALKTYMTYDPFGPTPGTEPASGAAKRRGPR